MSTADNTYVLNPEVHTSSKVAALLKEGKVPLCPVCKARLVVALSSEDAKRQKVNPGMRCPNNASHFESEVYLY